MRLRGAKLAHGHWTLSSRYVYPGRSHEEVGDVRHGATIKVWGGGFLMSPFSPEDPLTPEDLKPALIEFVPQSVHNRNPWSDTWSNQLWLLTPEEFEQLPDGEMLTSIWAEVMIKGTDYIDQDTRGGYIAFGYRESQLPKVPGR